VAGGSTMLSAYTIAAAVNDDGDVAGTSVQGGANQAFIIRDGTLTLLDALPSEFGAYGSGNWPFSGANDLNDADTVVGWSSDGSGTNSHNSAGGGEHPVVWRPYAVGGSSAAFDFGQLMNPTANGIGWNCDIPAWDCYGSATNVTAYDDVVGQAEFTHTPNLNHYYLFPWLVPGGTRPLVTETSDPTLPSSPDMLFYLDTGATTATSYNVSGIGQGASPSQDQVVVWPDPADSPNALGNSAICTTNAGSTPTCTTVPLDTSWHQGVRHAINSSGMVIGRSDSTGLAGVWYQNTVTVLSPLAGDSGTIATAINRNGDVVGSSIPGGSSTACPSAVLWPAGKYDQPIDLNAAESSKDEQLFIAQDISDTNDIVGQGGTCGSGGSYVGNANPWELLAPAPTTAKLSVALAGGGSGTVTGTGTGAPSGINCPTTCSQNFALGSTVTLTASPANGSSFTGFSGGGCSGTASSCVVTLTQAQDVTATFTAGPGSSETGSSAAGSSGTGSSSGSGGSGSTNGGVGTSSALAPKCWLLSRGRGVLLKRSKKSKQRPGTLTLTARCTQSLSAKLTGKVTVTALKLRHRKRKTKSYAVHAIRISLAAGRTRSVTPKLPAAVLTALRHHHRESASFTLVGTNADGTGRATVRIRALTGLT
jgi:hypothetical protein